MEGNKSSEKCSHRKNAEFKALRHFQTQRLHPLFYTVYAIDTHTHIHITQSKAVSCLIVVAGNSCRVSLRSFVMGNKTQQSKNKLPASTGSSCCHGKTNLKGWF